MHRLHRRGDAVVHEGVALACFLRLEVLPISKLRIVPAKRVVKALASNCSMRRDAADAVADVVPAFGDGIADRGNQAEAGDYDASLRHGRCLELRERRLK